MEFAADELLDPIINKKSYLPKPEHDLEMLVKCFYCSLFPKYCWDVLHGETSIEYVKYLGEFWKSCAGTVWGDLLGLARKGDYNAIKNEILKLAPICKVRFSTLIFI